MKKIVRHFLRIVNETNAVEVQGAYNEYQALYDDIKQIRRRSEKALASILASVDSLVDFILVELGKCINQIVIFNLSFLLSAYSQRSCHFSEFCSRFAKYPRSRCSLQEVYVECGFLGNIPSHRTWCISICRVSN